MLEMVDGQSLILTTDLYLESTLQRNEELRGPRHGIIPIAGLPVTGTIPATGMS